MRNDEHRNTCHCGERIHRLGEVWVHTVSSALRCYPTHTHPVDRQLKARPRPEDDQ